MTAAADRARVTEALTRSAALIAALEQDRAGIIAASAGSNADDEHDPEGATIAFEREQLAALLARARRDRAELQLALARIEDGCYGVCERCGGRIAPERLEARPAVRACIACARAG